ncbi:hypothetical protein ACEXAJ_11575 [Fusobacterium necrophorum subsp. funduliforme]
MNLLDIQEIKEVGNVEIVNELLKTGWKLLQICEQKNRVIYCLGKS